MTITMHDIGEIVGTAIVVAMFALLAWTFMAATPAQMSAECDMIGN